MATMGCMAVQTDCIAAAEQHQRGPKVGQVIDNRRTCILNQVHSLFDQGLARRVCPRLMGGKCVLNA